MTAGHASARSEARAEFCYEEAFSRNLGWLTEWEQQALRHKRIAIAGMGGVGGFHLLTLARFGVGAFSIADLDKFELVNFNRQIGATVETIGRSKAQVMAEAALQINPELRIRCFDEGVSEANLNEFLSDVDLCIDGLDFFALDVRRRVYARCRKLGIPVMIAVPLGMGTGYLIFQPDGMSFEEWFRVDGVAAERQYVRFLLGVAPSALHRSYLVDLSRVDLRGQRGPSTVAGCELCAAVAGVEAIKILLRRGRIRAVPYYHQFDPYRGRWVVKKLRGGNAHPRQRIKIALTARLAAKLSQLAVSKHETNPRPLSEIEKILDAARWAPSSDNTQPWRFEIVDARRVVIHLIHEPGDLYDYRDGEPTLLAAGMLLESLRIAASCWNRGLTWQCLERKGNTRSINVILRERSEIAPDALVSYLPLRSVDRRPYRLQALHEEQKAALAAALGPDLQIEWHESLGQRYRMAQLGANSTAIRLRTPEAFPIHQRVLDWDHAYSAQGIPAAAAGIAGPSLWLMRWGMTSWPRMQLLNRLGGVLAAAIQMDYLPGLLSAAFFTIRFKTPASTSDANAASALIAAGMGIQRFWLTATRLGIAVQPCLAPICFASYGAARTEFTSNQRIKNQAVKFSISAQQRHGLTSSMIFRGRLGVPLWHKPNQRSVRRQLDELLTGMEDRSRRERQTG